MKKQSKAGGRREGSGRKKGEPTKAIGLRVPVKYHKQIVDMVRKYLLKLSE